MKYTTLPGDLHPNDLGSQVKAVLEKHQDGRAIFFRRTKEGDIEFAIPESPDDEDLLNAS